MIAYYGLQFAIDIQKIIYGGAEIEDAVIEMMRMMIAIETRDTVEMAVDIIMLIITNTMQCIK